MRVRSFRVPVFGAAAVAVVLAGCTKKTHIAKVVTPSPPAVAPTDSLSASPDSVVRDQSIKFIWNTENANEISITGIRAATGSTSAILQLSTTGVLTAKGPGRSKEASAHDTVNTPPPTVAYAAPNDTLLFSQNIWDALFDHDRYAIRPDEVFVVQADAKFLAAHPNYKLLFSGHCGENGSEDYNLTLGDNLTDSVRDQMEKLRIGADRIRTISHRRKSHFVPRRPKRAGNSTAGAFSHLTLTLFWGLCPY